jgi:hypothetical protein
VPSAGWRIREIPNRASSPKTLGLTAILLLNRPHA